MSGNACQLSLFFSIGRIDGNKSGKITKFLQTFAKDQGKDWFGQFQNYIFFWILPNDGTECLGFVVISINKTVSAFKLLKSLNQIRKYRNSLKCNRAFIWSVRINGK